MRLIDADAFKEQLENAYEYTELSEVIKMLDNAPTVEPKQNNVTIPHVEKLVLCLVDTIENISWDEEIGAYKADMRGEKE